MPKPNIRSGKAKTKLQARRIRRNRLVKDAMETVELVKATGIGDRQGVLLLILDLAEGDITGYTNVDPIVAALALVEYLERKYPRVKRSRPTTACKSGSTRPSRKHRDRL